MKYHICREKMQLSRAKPGNPASSFIYKKQLVKNHANIKYRV